VYAEQDEQAAIVAARDEWSAAYIRAVCSLLGLPRPEYVLVHDGGVVLDGPGYTGKEHDGGIERDDIDACIAAGVDPAAEAARDLAYAPGCWEHLRDGQ
jgi:hypothetical protein